MSLALTIALALAGCAGPLAAGTPAPLAAATHLDDPGLYLQWLGASSWVISRGHAVLVVDPFFSRPSLPAVLAAQLLGNFDYRADRIRAVLPDLPAGTRAVLIGHAHYDHLLDLPYYMARGTYTVVGSRSASNLLQGFQPAGLDVRVAEDWFARSIALDSVRVTPFPSDHAPHLLGHEFMAGEVPAPRRPARPWDFRQGRSVVYFVDFLDAGGAIRARVFVNGAASRPWVMQEIATQHAFLAEHPTDVAILCVPGWNKVHHYPLSVIEALHPRHLVFSHYDDFFAPYRAGEDPAAGMRFLPLADYRGFAERVRRLRSTYGFEIHEPRTGQALAFPGL